MKKGKKEGGGQRWKSRKRRKEEEEDDEESHGNGEGNSWVGCNHSGEEIGVNEANSFTISIQFSFLGPSQTILFHKVGITFGKTNLQLLHIIIPFLQLALHTHPTPLYLYLQQNYSNQQPKYQVNSYSSTA